MLPRRYSTEAVVLTRKNYGEADRILAVFSKHYGKLRLIAKGVRKPKSRKRGHIEVFTQFKFSASRGKGLDIVTETEEINSFDEIRKDLRKTSVAYYLVETVDKITHDEEQNKILYSNLVRALNRIINPSSLRKLRQDFIYDTLVLLGYWPLGRKMDDYDAVLENIVERKINSSKVGKKLLT